jgi:hypothetical protein
MANFRIIDRSTIEVPPECVTDPDLANCLLWAFPYIVEDLTNGSYWYGGHTYEECEDYIEKYTNGN